MARVNGEGQSRLESSKRGNVPARGDSTEQSMASVQTWKLVAPSKREPVRDIPGGWTIEATEWILDWIVAYRQCAGVIFRRGARIRGCYKATLSETSFETKDQR